VRRRLDRIQNELFDLGADLSVPGGDRLRIEQPYIDRLEAEIDDANARLEPLKSFVRPGGTETAARLYLARGLQARRACRSRRRGREPARRGLPQPAVGSPVRARAAGERRRRAALAAGQFPPSGATKFPRMES
jgi:hypothetical protein